MDPIHLRPTAELAPRVLLPGDPGRALLLAQALLETPKMFNHHRGLWGYSGVATADGGLLTIQSTGMGGASAAIVVEELIALGADVLVRVGTCGALAPQLGLGDLIVAGDAVAEDGASRSLGSDGLASADATLTEALVAEPGLTRGAARVVSTDLFYAPDETAARARWREAGAAAVEMECAAVFTVAALRGARAGAVLAVSDVLDASAGRVRITEEALEEAGRRLGEAALAGLRAVGST